MSRKFKIPERKFLRNFYRTYNLSWYKARIFLNKYYIINQYIYFCFSTKYCKSQLQLFFIMLTFHIWTRHNLLSCKILRDYPFNFLLVWRILGQAFLCIILYTNFLLFPWEIFFLMKLLGQKVFNISKFWIAYRELFNRKCVLFCIRAGIPGEARPSAHSTGLTHIFLSTKCAELVLLFILLRGLLRLIG